MYNRYVTNNALYCSLIFLTSIRQHFISKFIKNKKNYFLYPPNLFLYAVNSEVKRMTAHGILTDVKQLPIIVYLFNSMFFILSIIINNQFI